MMRRRLQLSLLLLLALAVGGVWLAFRQGIIPARYSPLPRLDLTRPATFFVDWQLAELRQDRELCAAVLGNGEIEAEPIPDRVDRQGCGWTNGVRVSSAGGAQLPIDALSCPVAAALAMWMAHDVQPLARDLLGQPVTAIQHMGSFACRNIVGNKLLKGMRSEHATANAIDIAGFTLANGQYIGVLKTWETNTPEAAFLHAVHQRACRYFRVSLGPEFNRAHRDHFHFDRGFLTRCK